MVALLVALSLAAEPAAEPTAADRGVAFLAREVPQWRPRNRCFSCHNNGDAARALYFALAAGRKLDARVLAETSDWLRRPNAWKDNGGDPRYNDPALVRIQFASALAQARVAGQVPDPQVLVHAASLVAADQQPDGSWKIDVGGMVGAPATYGPALATAQARRVLLQADRQRFQAHIEKADAWLRQAPVRTVLDAAGVLLGLAGQQDQAARTQEEQCLAIVRKGQSKDSGWGPYVSSPPEPFDTAVVLLALERFRDREEIRGLIESGRRYLVSTQRSDGAWPATTRPAGADSYAQQISTTAWATLALLATGG